MIGRDKWRWTGVAKCPKCSAEVEQPLKTWTLKPRGRKGIIIGLFKCPNGHYFRAKVGEEK